MNEIRNHNLGCSQQQQGGVGIGIDDDSLIEMTTTTKSSISTWDISEEFSRLVLEHHHHHHASSSNTTPTTVSSSSESMLKLSVGEIQNLHRIQNACQLTRAWTVYAYVCECFAYSYESTISAAEMICKHIISDQVITDFLFRRAFDVSCAIRMLTLIFIDRILMLFQCQIMSFVFNCNYRNLWNFY
jgi:hypothetical protein